MDKRLCLLAGVALTAICASVCSAQDYRAKVQASSRTVAMPLCLALR